MNEAKNTQFMNEANMDAYTRSLDLVSRMDQLYATGTDPWAKMAFEEYQKFVNSTKVYPERYAITYPALGLSEEAGEVAGKVKKWLRGDTPNLDRDSVKKELGDVLWYVTSLATDLGFSLEEVAIANIVKIKMRKETGTLKGSGDNRELEITDKLKFS
jgi:NTP pyrophosphatase (non-canonical NTP hydrolase)